MLPTVKKQKLHCIVRVQRDMDHLPLYANIQLPTNQRYRVLPILEGCKQEFPTQDFQKNSCALFVANM